jgi:hypothetical protein
MTENPNKDVVIYDPVLCSIAGWYSSYDKAEIKKFVCSVFQKPEIKSAMYLLGDTEKIQGVRAPRNHQSGEACFDSILNNLEYLDQANQMPIIAVTSADINKMPIAKPGEQGDGMPNGRLVALEKSVAVVVANHKEVLDKIEQIRPTFSQVTAAVPGMQPGRDNLSLPPPAQSRPPPATQQPLHARQPHYVSTVPRRLPPNVRNDNSLPKESSPDASDWNTVNRRRTKVVRGTASVAGLNSQSNRVGWTPAPRDIFVYHTNHLTTAEDISDLMKAQSKVSPMNIEKRSKEYAYFGSFRVTVRRDDFDEAMKPEHWPAGWSIREYYVSRERREVERLQRANASSNDGMNSQLSQVISVTNVNTESAEVSGPIEQTSNG